MSEQFQETIAISSPDSLPIDINELTQQYLTSSANHMIGNEISLPFPPTIEPKDLIVNKKFPQPNGKQSRAPNAFIIYRKAFVKAAREQGYILPMTAISSMASAQSQESTAIIAPPITTPISSSSSPNLSESDSNTSEKSFVFQPQQFIDNNIDGVQITDNYLVDSYLPIHFQEYLNSNFYLPKEDYQNGNNFLLTNWLNQSENYTLEPNELEFFDTTFMDDFKNNSHSSLNMTLSEAMGISEDFNLDF
ncbi:18710_t:CDS:2 [Rhizophagus irregularis]|nr:18710_t:CDS:2 [Rhizophagus irregularis]